MELDILLFLASCSHLLMDRLFSLLSSGPALSFSSHFSTFKALTSVSQNTFLAENLAEKGTWSPQTVLAGLMQELLPLAVRPACPENWAPARCPAHMPRCAGLPGAVYYERSKSSWSWNLPRPMLECVCSLPGTCPSGCSDAPVCHQVTLLLRLQPSGLCVPHSMTASCDRCTWPECQFSSPRPPADC